MALIFQGSDQPTIGVEIEFQIIDAKTLDLVPQSKEILEVCKGLDEQRIKPEIHQSMIEVNSEVCESINQCREFLSHRISRLSDIAESFGLQIAVTGTHPFQRWADRLISDTDRYHNIHEKYQWLARRMNVYGMHVHIGVPSGERALTICRKMTQYLPHLLALSANSPFWQGIDTGMQSSRVNILDSFPFAGLLPDIYTWQQLEHYYDTLNKAGAIRSFKDLYWYVRPNLLYGTVEIRICDAMTTLEETMALVALIQCLVVKINKALERGEKEEWTMEHNWIAPENQWTAARDGLEGVIAVDFRGKKQKISEAIIELIDSLTPIAEELGCQEDLFFLYRILKKGNGAQRQQRIYQDTGSLREVVALSLEHFKSSLLVKSGSLA